MRDVVCLNAAAALVVADAAPDLRAGAARAARALDEGGAAEVLARVVQFTTRDGGSA
jgi:anthranilate phosphoribosyltransferase